MNAIEAMTVTEQRAELPIHYAELESIYSQTIDRGVRSLAITSCNGGEGTTTLACALAKRAQAGGHRTLLIDMNFCRPAIGPELGIEQKPWRSLERHFSDEIELTPAQADYQGEGCLAVLPGPATPTGSLLLREKQYLDRCIQAWLAEYEVVIIDTSPLNAINRHNIPAERIAAECDGVLLTVRAGVTLQSQVVSAVARLEAMDVQLSGCVFNDIENPSLAEELIRETHRLQRWLPGLMSWLRQRVQRSALLNMGL